MTFCLLAVYFNLTLTLLLAVIYFLNALYITFFQQMFAIALLILEAGMSTVSCLQNKHFLFWSTYLRLRQLPACVYLLSQDNYSCFANTGYLTFISQVSEAQTTNPTFSYKHVAFHKVCICYMLLSYI